MASTGDRWRQFRRLLRRLFILWAVLSTVWLFNSFRTQGVPARLLESDATVEVDGTTEYLHFRPLEPSGSPLLVFLCGAGVAAEAYAPLLHEVAASGYEVYCVRLPYRLAPLESHKATALVRVRQLIDSADHGRPCVVGGHSLGAALAARFVKERPQAAAGLVLVGTTHPKLDDLSNLTLPVTKIVGDKDGVAPLKTVLDNARLLPQHTKWVTVQGGNHSQFGHYGHQLFDGRPSIHRKRQQQLARDAILELLRELN